MFDANKIIIGLAVSAVLVGFPFWYSWGWAPEDRDGDGTPDYKPQPVLPDGGDGCIESREFMRANHMILLDEWRNAVVRDGDRTYVAKKDGKSWDRSLSRTCMSCHTNRMQFCNECHTYVDVEPDCWDCHVEPEKALEEEVAPAPKPTERLPAARPPARRPQGFAPPGGHRVPKPPPMDPRRLQKGRQ